jgi:hypothetical protein
MNETTTAQAKAANPICDPFGMSKYQMPKMEVPAQFREMTDKSLAQVRDACSKAKVAKGATDYNLKLIDFGRSNTRAAFDYAHELWAVKSPSEFIELSTTHMRRQFEIASAQSKELYALGQEIAGEAAAPIKAGMSKAFNKVA